MGYYDAIETLGIIDSSEQVSFSRNQLIHLAKEEIAERLQRDDMDSHDSNGSPRIPLHEFLGQLSNRQLEAAATYGEYDWDHSLLGPYVPRKNLEALSANDFAAFFMKKQFEDGKRALERVSLIPSSDFQTNGVPQSYANGSLGPSGEDTTYKKALVCSRCKARFNGPRKSSEFENHRCLGM